MSGRIVSGVVPSALFVSAQQVASYEGMTMSALVSAALTLYLGLPAPARRIARHALTAGTAETRAALLEGCSRAIAVAADQQLAADLAARAEAWGLQNATVSEAAIEAEAVAAVREARAARRGTNRQTGGR